MMSAREEKEGSRSWLAMLVFTPGVEGRERLRAGEPWVGSFVHWWRG